jgi:hypothetical protein
VVFQRNDKTTQYELFYYGLLEVLEAEQSRELVYELLRWYDKYVVGFLVINVAFRLNDTCLGNSSLDKKLPRNQDPIVH